MIKYNQTISFAKDFKRLNKKLKTLSEDFHVAKKNAIELFHLNHLDNQSVVPIPGYKHKFLQIYKLRKFACKALKGKGAKSGIRITYAHNQNINEITFLKMYFKANKESESAKRIKDFLKTLN